MLEGCGETFPVGDAAALRIKLQAACDTWPERKNMRGVVAASHDWEKVADETLRIYKEVRA